jgi:hypothetical protein
MIADTPDEFYRAILQCITQPNQWREIGLNARVTAEKYHDINENAGRMLAIYHTLIVS